MGTRSFTWFLLVCLLSGAYGAREWLRYQWNELSADEQIKWTVGLSLFFLFTFAHLLSPLFIKLFF